MPTPSQVAATGGAVAISTAVGYGLTYAYSEEGSGSESSYSEPKPTVEPDTFKTKPLEEKYQGKLISLFKEDSLSKLLKPSSNKEWWDWIYRNIYLPKKNQIPSSSPFYNLVEEGNSIETLSNACDGVYRKTTTEYKFDNSNLLENIAEFCTTPKVNTASFLEPTVTKHESIPSDEYNSGLLNQEENRKYLVKIADNDYWWKWAYQYLVKGKVANTTFSSISNESNEVDALKNKCNESYKKNKQELSTGTSLDDIKKFCTIGLTPSNLLPPKEIDPTEPSGVTTVTEQDANHTNYSNKFLSITKQDNLQHLVKTQDETNKKWWDWAFKKKYKGKKQDNELETFFQGIDKGWGATGDTKALNQACETAYKQDYSLENHLLTNIKDFCTKGLEGHDVSEPKASGSPITDVSTNETYKNGLLSNETNKANLVQNDPQNENWFKWAYKTRVDENQKSTYVAPFNGVTTYSTDTAGTTKSINKLCDASYKKDREDFLWEGNSDKQLDQIKKLCSLNPDTALQLPTSPAEPTTGIKFLNSDSSNPTGRGKPYENSALIKVESNQGKLLDPDKSENKSWWNWVYTNRYDRRYKTTKNNLPAPFKGVSQGHSSSAGSGNNQTALNQACKEAYKKNKKALDATTEGKTLIKAIKEFCSPISSGPLNTPTEPSYTLLNRSGRTADSDLDGSVLLKDNNNKDKLIDPDHDFNVDWWEHKYKSYEKDENKTNLPSPFTGLSQAYNKSSDATALNQACKTAYKQNKETLIKEHENNRKRRLIDEIHQYCSPFNDYLDEPK